MVQAEIINGLEQDGNYIKIVLDHYRMVWEIVHRNHRYPRARWHYMNNGPGHLQGGLGNWSLQLPDRAKPLWGNSASVQI